MGNEKLKTKLHMALSEAGYPNAVIEDHHDLAVRLGTNKDQAPNQVVWKAWTLVAEDPMPCYICWAVGYGEECSEGECHADDPGMPVAEELYDKVAR